MENEGLQVEKPARHTQHRCHQAEEQRSRPSATKSRERGKTKNRKISGQTEGRERYFANGSVGASQNRLALRRRETTNVLPGQVVHRQVDRVGQPKQRHESRENKKKGLQPPPSFRWRPAAEFGQGRSNFLHQLILVSPMPRRWPYASLQP